MACSTCLAALDKLIRSLDESEITHANHHESFMGLAESSAQGCPFCLALWDQSPEQDRDVLLRGSDSVSSFTDDPHDNGRHSSDEAQQVLGATRSFAFTDGNREEGIVYFCLRYRDRVTAISRLQNKHVERDFRLVPCGPPSTEGTISHESCIRCRADRNLQTVGNRFLSSPPGRLLPDRHSRGLLRKLGSLHASRITQSATRVKTRAGFQRG